MVAMSDPTNVRALDDLEVMTGLDVRPVVASAEDIVSAIANASRLDDVGRRGDLRGRGGGERGAGPSRRSASPPTTRRSSSSSTA